MLGQTLGSYTVERELGRGGMGAVYTAVHTLLGRRAAVKVLLAELSRNQDLVQRFFNEARAATAIKHPSIVEIYDFGWAADGSAYIVMELMDGESLASRIKRQGRLTAAQAATIGRQVANALAAAHRAGIVHRDLKPDNVFLVPDEEVAGGERVKLLDFGIAKLAAAGAASRTTTGAIMGTPMYMSPEQCEGAREVDHRTDLYSLGCMLFEMVAGRVPFVSEGVGGLIGMHLHVPPPELRTLAPDAPPELAAIVARLLAKAPAERYQTADEVAAALGRLTGVATTAPGAAVSAPGTTSAAAVGLAATALGGPATGPSGGGPTTLSAAASAQLATDAQPATSSRRGLWIALGGVVLAGGVVAAVLAGGSSSTPHGGATGDAGAAVAVAVDAAVPIDPLLLPAQKALTERRFDAAAAMAGEILISDPGNASALAIRDQAVRGAKATAALTAMRTALAGRTFATVRANLDAVYDQTDDRDPLRAEADAVMAEARPQAIAAERTAISKLVKAGRCSTARKQAADALAAWGGDAQPLEKLAAGCKESSSGGDGVSIDAGVGPGGPLSRDAFLAVFNNQRPRTQMCARRLNLTGTYKATIVVAPSGRVDDVKVAGDVADGVRCLQLALRSMQFPASDSGLTVSVPLVFAGRPEPTTGPLEAPPAPLEPPPAPPKY